jgi:hypothetical protein
MNGRRRISMMRDNPLENTFYQFGVLVGLIGGLVLIVLGIVTSQPGQTLVGSLLFLIGFSWLAMLVYRYGKMRL